jgi:3-phenylpropionate/cinnamic acid dioxygenase small subunit
MVECTKVETSRADNEEEKNRFAIDSSKVSVSECREEKFDVRANFEEADGTRI